jgi:hypothetical protein
MGHHLVIVVSYIMENGCHPNFSLKSFRSRRLHRACRAEAVAGTKGHLLRGGLKGQVLRLVKNIMTYIIYVWLYELYVVIWNYICV